MDPALIHGKIIVHPNGITFYQLLPDASIHGGLHEAFTHWKTNLEGKLPFGFQVAGVMTVPVYITDTYATFGDRFETMRAMETNDFVRWMGFWVADLQPATT